MSALSRGATIAGAATLVALVGRRLNRARTTSTGFGFGPHDYGLGPGTDDFGYDAGADPDSDVSESGRSGRHGGA